MAIKIKGLLEVISLDRITQVLLDAFIDSSPKLLKVFPNDYTRKNALEMTLRYYGQYDMYYGKAYTLDEDVFEVALLLESNNVNTSKRRCLNARCYSYEYQEIKVKMPVEERKKRLKLFAELKKLEKKIPVPKEYLYLDYIGVAKDKQGEGRGSRLMEEICDYADAEGLPVILFTSSIKTKKFYGKFNFTEVESLISEEFGFTYICLMREPGSA